jgi:hypothetical protein
VRDLDIAEVVQRSGVRASTLRFYEEKGLIASIGRRGLRRLFDPGVLEQLAPPSHMECPSFRRFVRAAASGAIGVRRKSPQA